MDESIPFAWLQPGWLFASVAAGVLIVALLLRGLLRRILGHRYDALSRRLEDSILTTVILGMIGLSVIQIILRNVFQSGWIWIDPFLRALVLWLAFLGAIAATAKGRHIAIDVFSRVLPANLREPLGRLLAFISAVVCLAMANGAWEYLRLELEFRADAFAGLETWQVQLILLFGFWMLAYRFAVVVAHGPPAEVAAFGAADGPRSDKGSGSGGDGSGGLGAGTLEGNGDSPGGQAGSQPASQDAGQDAGQDGPVEGGATP